MPGLWFEELEPGLVIKHEPSRTVTETDNLLFTALTHNAQPLHLDAEFSAGTQHGQRIVNSIFTMGLAVGLSVAGTTLRHHAGQSRLRRNDIPQSGVHRRHNHL